MSSTRRGRSCRYPPRRDTRWTDRSISSRRHEVAIDEPFVAPDDLPEPILDGGAEARAVGDERVKLSPLAARIHRRRQIGEECAIVQSAGEITVELRCIDADEPRGDAGREAPLRERRRRLAPERKDGSEPGPGEQPLSISADVLEKEITERDRRDIGMKRARRGEAVVKGCFVRRIRTRRSE